MCLPTSYRAPPSRPYGGGADQARSRASRKGRHFGRLLVSRLLTQIRKEFGSFDAAKKALTRRLREMAR
jgi:hypothetical protein